MLKTWRTLILATAVALTLISVTHGGVVDLDGAIRDTLFFKKLTDTERRALISLAIAYHDAPEDSNVAFPTNPEHPSRPKSEEIPSTVYTKMMNGGVPKRWMKNFISWLQDGLKITDGSLDLYRQAKEDKLCNANECFEIQDVGQRCCPFG